MAMRVAHRVLWTFPKDLDWKLDDGDEACEPADMRAD